MGGPRAVVLGVLILGVVGLVAAGPVAGQQNVTLTVTVVNEQGGTVADVDLTATWDDGSVEETTRSNGQALIDVPAGADVEIAVDHDEYMRNVPFEIEDASEREVEVPVAHEGFAAVSVTDADGEPVNGATVRFQDGGVTAASVRSGSNGVAESGPIEHSSYALIVSKPGFYEYRETVTVGDASEFDVTIERGTVPVTFTVVDDHFEDPRPIENATIAIEPLGTTLRTLSGGETETRLPVNTDYEITVSNDGYVAESSDLRLGESGREISLSINRETSLELSVANTQIVLGESTTVTVRNAYGEPVEGATVSVAGESVGETDSQGTLSVTIDEAGTLTIEATADGESAAATVEGFDPDATPSPTPTPTETDGGLGPGPGLVGAALAIALGVGLLARRR